MASARQQTRPSVPGTGCPHALLAEPIPIFSCLWQRCGADLGLHSFGGCCMAAPARSDPLAAVRAAQQAWLRKSNPRGLRVVNPVSNRLPLRCRNDAIKRWLHPLQAEQNSFGRHRHRRRI